MAQLDPGGGLTSGVCSISPTDDKAIIGNLIERISDIERFLSQIVAADVHANNLSELARDLGNVANGTLMLPNTPNSPWAGTGGTIPVPAGYNGSVINGNVLTTWENGVVSVQMIGGQGITTGGSGTHYLIVQPSSSSLSGSGLAATANLSTIIRQGGSAFGTSKLNISKIKILRAGLYQISAVFPTAVRTSGGSTWLEARITDSSGLTVKAVQDLFGQNAGGNGNQTFRMSFSFYCLANYNLQLLWNNTNGTFINTAVCILSVVKIG